MPVRLLACAAAIGAAAAGAAQVRPEVGADPYTNGDPAALARAGYVRFGPFPFGTGHTTEDVDELLGTEPLIWIETAHFRLGCALPAVRLARDPELGATWTTAVHRELAELRKALPEVPRRPRMLDPWLRAHLFARRLEALYAEVADHLDVADGAGPAPSWQDGSGPYLGMREKFAVLLLQTKASHARYTRAWHGVEMDDPIRLHDAAFDCMYWGGSEETSDGLLARDLAMHAHVVFNVAHNLYSGYRGYRRALPAWLVTGLGHWHARRVSPRFPAYDRRDDRDRAARSPFWQWDDRVRGLVEHDVFEPLSVLAGRADAGAFGLEQHMQAWAVVDHLAASRPAATFHFVRLCKQSGLARDDAFEQAFGCTLDEIDASWRGAVLAAKRR